MRTIGLKVETRKENGSTYTLKIKKYPRGSKVAATKGFVNIYNGKQGGTYWPCFYVKDNIFLFIWRMP